MATQEFYIRSASETEARGPFSQEQLASLTEAGQVNPETLYYDATTEDWVAIGSNYGLRTILFPEKRKLKIRTKDRVATLNKDNDVVGPVSVEHLLAAAEGKTDDVRVRADSLDSQERAARIGIYSAIVMLVISAASLILPAIDILTQLEFSKLYAQPFAVVGLLDLLLALLLSLGMFELYPLVRFRAAAGLGMMAFVYWLEADIPLLITSAIGLSGLYLTTLFTRNKTLIPAVLVGLGGLGTFAYFTLTRG